MNWQSMIDPAFELELLNGDGLLIGTVFLICVAYYVRIQMAGLGLGFRDWVYFRLPEHINFAVAVGVCDTGVCIRAAAIWIWRRFLGGGPMPMWLFGLLILGAVLIVAGGLCKVRSLSNPFHIPKTTIVVRLWLVTFAAICIFMAASILTGHAADRPEKPDAWFCMHARMHRAQFKTDKAAEDSARAQGASQATIDKAHRCRR